MTYSLAKSLPAARITRDAIRQIEDLIKFQIAAQVGDGDQLQKNIANITISITDKIGTEEFQFADDVPSKFPGDTECVEIEFRGEYGTKAQGMRVRIKLDRNNPRALIVCSGKNAKTLALGMTEAVSGVLRVHGNSNSWAHRPGVMLLVTASLLLIINALNVIAIDSYKPGLMVTSIAVSVFQLLYTFLFPKLAPFTTYESMRDDASLDWRRWSIRAVIAAAIVTPLFSFIYSFLTRN